MERPIIFSTQSVQATLDKRKSQTRRIVKLQYEVKDEFTGKSKGIWTNIKAKGLMYQGPISNNDDLLKVCPYGKPGDVLYVKETWRPKGHNFPTGFPYEWKATAEQDGVPIEGPWKSSRFMPKSASRIKLLIKNIRVERVQDISNEDAWCEGVSNSPEYDCVAYFRETWESIYGKGAWDRNDWVWVITFSKLN